MELEPTRIGGKYEILRELGSGGSATVYLAREVATELGAERLVAIKVLRDDGTMSDARQRFSQEIRVMANLRHPHIVPLFDTGIWDGRPYLVMPYIEGESLAARIKREGKLSVEAVVKMGIQVCEALDYAHSQHLVHRDVKPSNILFDANGNAWLSDFGVARWTELTGDDRPTRSSAGAPGTMAYASPEQIAGDRHLDGRTDVYGLGVSLCEAGTGQLPFSSTNPREFLARKLAGVVLNPAPIEAPLGEIIARAMAPEPTARWATCLELCEALRGLQQNAPSFPKRTRRMLPLAGAAAALVLAGAAYVAATDATPAPQENLVALVVNGVEGPTNIAAAELERHLRRYSDIEVIRLEPQKSGGGTATAALTAARAAGAARVLAVEARPDLESGMRAIALSVSAAEPSRRVHSIPYLLEGATDGASLGQFWVSMVDSLLFGAIEPSSATPLTGTRISSARAHFLRGYALVRAWQLAEADSAFVRALLVDPQYTEAATWLAQTRFWADSAVASWEPHLVRSSTFRRPLGARTVHVLTALKAAAARDWMASCGAYQAQIGDDGEDFAAWMGLGECRRRNDVVVRDDRSPSGWRFQSSIHGALQASRRAFALLPQGGVQLQKRELAVLRRMMYTDSRRPRAGRAEGGGALYAAQPSWDLEGDTLQFVPYPIEELAAHTPATLAIAVSKSRIAHTELVQRWASSDAENPEALEELAFAQEHQGDSSAMGTLQKAITFARSAPDERRLKVHLFHSLIRFGAPDREAHLSRAWTLGDSLLRTDNGAGGFGAASVALLLGRDPTQSLRASARSRVVSLREGSIRLSATLMFELDRLTVAAAVGAPFDSLTGFKNTVLAELSNTAAEREVQSAAAQLLTRASQLAFIGAGRHLIEVPRDGQNDVLQAQVAIRRGDTSAARRMLAETANIRRNIPKGEVSLDAIVVEADLLLRIGDAAGAAAWLRDGLASLKWAEPRALGDPVLAASFVRTVRYAIEVAKLRRDRTTADVWSFFLMSSQRQ